MVAVGKTGQGKNILTLTRLQAPVPKDEHTHTHTIPDLTWSSETWKSPLLWLCINRQCFRSHNSFPLSSLNMLQNPFIQPLLSLFHSEAAALLFFIPNKLFVWGLLSGVICGITRLLIAKIPLCRKTPYIDVMIQIDSPDDCAPFWSEPHQDPIPHL